MNWYSTHIGDVQAVQTLTEFSGEVMHAIDLTPGTFYVKVRDGAPKPGEMDYFLRGLRDFFKVNEVVQSSCGYYTWINLTCL